MPDYRKTLERLQKMATDGIDEIDSKLGLKEKIEDGAKAVADAARSGTDYLRTEAERTEIGRKAAKVAEDVFETAGDAARAAWSVSEPVRSTAAQAGAAASNAAAQAAGQAADAVSDTADAVGTGARRVASVVGFGASVASVADSARRAGSKAGEWVKEDPARAAVTGAAMAIGAGLGVVVSGLSTHWLMNSAIPAWTVKQLADNFDGYLRRREELIDAGQLSEADAERIAFERDIAKRVGAPLLGAFAFASGAVMLTNIFAAADVTGFPVGTIIGGQPLLEGIWFFANGMICFKTSYDFFMIALDGDEDVESMVAEIRGLLPSPA
ncbi:MAG: hypothetical protein KF736_00905 [Acidobacteria bacterium]|nr:hypothetical protein [Acidobacteriota bacterium]MCW5948034.1 hypothetical protein [Pyrinomonadaceae bacterium]